MKRFGLLLAIAALVLFSAATTQASLVTLYTFDNSADLGANAVSAAQNGTPTNGPTAAVDAVVGGAVHFVGSTSSSTNQYIGVPTVAPPASFGNSGTLSVWFKGDIVNVGDLQVMSRDWSLWFVINGGKPGVALYASTGGVNNYWCPAANSWPDLTNWHLITCTWAYDAGTSRGRGQTYIDGVAAIMTYANHAGNTWKSNSAFNSTITGDCVINGYKSAEGLTGDMDDFAAWNEELTGPKAAALYSLATDALDYNAKDADALFQVYDNAGNKQTSDGKTWTKVTGGLGSTAGAIVDLGGGVKGINLGGADGAGVQIVPEPGTLALLLGAALGLLVFAWRRRQ
jgi:hypothetical protein